MGWEIDVLLQQDGILVQLHREKNNKRTVAEGRMEGKESCERFPALLCD